MSGRLHLPQNLLSKFQFISALPVPANAASSEEISHYFETVATIAKNNGADEYRIVSNNGASSGQSVFHFHTHILSGSENKKLIDKNL